jgi:hypothetical protein
MPHFPVVPPTTWTLETLCHDRFGSRNVIAHQGNFHGRPLAKDADGVKCPCVILVGFYKNGMPDGILFTSITEHKACYSPTSKTFSSSHTRSSALQSRTPRFFSMECTRPPTRAASSRREAQKRDTAPKAPRGVLKLRFPGSPQPVCPVRVPYHFLSLVGCYRGPCQPATSTGLTIAATYSISLPRSPDAPAPARLRPAVARLTRALNAVPWPRKANGTPRGLGSLSISSTRAWPSTALRTRLDRTAPQGSAHRQNDTVVAAEQHALSAGHGV